MHEQTALPVSGAQIRAQAFTAAMVAIAFGAFVVAAVGFSGAAEIHNAAHDSRHSFAFPCH